MTDRKELAERLIDALSRIASKNDLAGIPAEQCPTAAYNALYECEIIARDALATVPAHIGEQCVKLRDHLSQALRQWQMYAELERDRDLKSEQSHEGELFRELLAALTAPPGDGWQPIETAPEGETVWTCWDGVNNRNEQ